MKIEFTNITYLKNGNKRQREAYILLEELEIMEKLQEYDPVLTGTIPIGIDIPESDLDIICHCSDHKVFTTRLKALFSDEEQFTISRYLNKNQQSTIATFRKNGFAIEIYGESCPTLEQNAYRHMIIEHQILQEKGEAFRAEIVVLKQSGLKTEPAFAKLLGLEGDPYEALLKI